MKKTAHFILFTIWILTVAVPPLVTVYSSGENALFVMTVGDEEQKEEGKKDTSEEKIVIEEHQNDLSFSLNKRNTALDNYVLGRSNHAPDIALPPPEHKV